MFWGLRIERVIWGRERERQRERKREREREKRLEI